ncbi:MAG: hypothetical protein AB2535_19135, partial [Candidatus Thiodiazotropha endolucinida]
EVEAAVMAVAEQQQGDAVWQVDMPDELEWRNGHTTAGVFDPNSEVDTGWGSVLGGPDGMMFTDEMRRELGAVDATGLTALPAGFPVGEASDAELQDALFGPVPPRVDSSHAGGVIAFGASETPAFTSSNADSGLQVDYGFLPQQGIDMGEPMTTVAGAVSVDDDPLGVSADRVEIGPRIGVGDYALTIGGAGWGLVKATATGLWNAGAAIFGPSERLQNLNNLEYAGGIDEYEVYPAEPGLSWEMIGDSLSAQIAQSNENARIAKANGDYFSLGMAYSENPLMQMSGLGDLAVFGTISKFGKLAPNSQLTKQEALQRMQEALRYRQLSWNHEQKQFSIIEAHGVSRAEQALGRRFKPSNIEGVDFLDPTGLGKISLKGPFLDKNLQPLKLGYQQKAAENILKHVEANKAVDIHIIDTKGLNDEVFKAMQETLKNSQTKIQYLR